MVMINHIQLPKVIVSDVNLGQMMVNYAYLYIWSLQCVLESPFGAFRTRIYNPLLTRWRVTRWPHG